MYLLERPLSTEEQLFMRDHLREVGQTVAFVAAVWATAGAAGCLAGWGLTHVIAGAHHALQRRRRPWPH